MSDAWAIVRTRMRPDSKTIAVIVPTHDRCLAEMRALEQACPEARIHRASLTAHVGKWQIVLVSEAAPESLIGMRLCDAVTSAGHALDIIRESDDIDA